MTITLRCGDALELMREMPDASVDAVITDPPYNVGIDYGERVNDNKTDYVEWCDKWFAECNRVARAILFTPGIGNLKLWMNKDPRWIMAWVKNNSMKRITIGFNNWEPILLWGKPRLNYYNDVIIAPFIPMPDGHPVPKPQFLYDKLVCGFTNEGDTILDPFMGSGTTGVACVKLGRNFIGYEIHEPYFKIAERRIAEAQLQMRLPMGV